MFEYFIFVTYNFLFKSWQNNKEEHLSNLQRRARKILENPPEIILVEAMLFIPMETSMMVITLMELEKVKANTSTLMEIDMKEILKITKSMGSEN